MEIPVTDAVGSLSSTLSDIDSMTIDDLNDDFGIDLIGSDPLVAKIVHGDDTLNSIADNMMSRVDGLTLEGDLCSQPRGRRSKRLSAKTVRWAS